ncbi:MAG: alpha-glucosidase C-terminal domain-containing protein [Microthrixaceae bacterium]
MANPHQLYLPVITEPGAHYENVNVEAQQHRANSLLSWMRQMITLRRRLTVMGRGDIEFHEPENPHVLAFVRSMEGEAPVLVVANLSRMAQAVELDLSAHLSHTPVEVFGRTLRPDRRAALLPHPRSLRVLLVRAGRSGGHGDRRAAAPARQLARGAAQPRHEPRPEALAARPQVVRRQGRADNRCAHRGLILLPDSEVGVLVVRLSFPHASDQRYLVPLGRVRHDRGASTYRLHGETVVATIDGDREEEHEFLIDAMADEESALALVALMASRRRTKGRALSLQGRPNGRAIRSAVEHAGSSEGPAVTMLDVEQSNSSVIVDGEVIAKLVRRLEPGPSRDATLPAALRSVGLSTYPRSSDSSRWTSARATVMRSAWWPIAWSPTTATCGGGPRTNWRAWSTR